MKKISDIATALEEELNKKLDALEAQLNKEREERLRLEVTMQSLSSSVQSLIGLLEGEKDSEGLKTSSKQPAE